MSNKEGEVTMKRKAILLAMLSIMAIWLSGCILSSSPSTSAVTIKVGDAQTFEVTGFLNGPYTWSWNDNPISGVTIESYTYTAILADKGDNILKVSTKDKLNGTTATVQWKVTVVDDLPPIANAGPDQNVHLGDPVQLDGSASSDPEDEALNYLWEMVGRPAGSNAALDNPNAEKPSFTTDVQGAYTFRLIVNDGRLNSPADTVIIYTNYGTPVANAGVDQSVLFGTVAQLDGSDSTNPESSPLTYQWAIDSGPAGSTAALDDPNAEKPSFTPDKKGVYVVSLVVNNGVYDSGIDLVVISVYNNPPVARAGADITVEDLGGTAQLDGSASSDPDGTPLTYAWTIISRPYGSTAALSDAAIANPTFAPDIKGAYIMKLVVSDGDLSNADTVIVTYTNHVPVANAGDPIVIEFTQTAQLQGSASDPDGDPLTYAWTEISKPDGSIAVLSNPAILNPTFKPDKQGVYEFSLIATDNSSISSAPSTMTISTTNHRPVAHAGDDIQMLFKNTVVLNGSGTDADSDLLTYAWTVINAPMGSIGNGTLSALDVANPTFNPDLRGDYELGLIVNDGQEDSLQDTMLIHVFNNAPVANAGASQPAVLYANRVVTLDGSLSSDPDGDPLTYQWTLVSKPALSTTAALSDTTIVNPTITLDVPGTYVLSLVVNDGVIDSGISTITLTTSTSHRITNWDNNVMAPWYTYASTGGTATLSTTVSRSPSYSLRIAGGGSGTPYFQQSVPVNTYVISVILYDRCSNSAQYNQAAMFESTTQLMTLPMTSTSAWSVAHTYNANRFMANVGVRVTGNTSTSRYVYFDDIDIYVWD
jgi:hypothetical protein